MVPELLGYLPYVLGQGKYWVIGGCDITFASHVCVFARGNYPICMMDNFGDLPSALILRRSGSGIADVRVLSGPLYVACGSPTVLYGCSCAVLVREGWLGRCGTAWMYCRRRDYISMIDACLDRFPEQRSSLQVKGRVRAVISSSVRRGGVRTTRSRLTLSTVLSTRLNTTVLPRMMKTENGPSATAPSLCRVSFSSRRSNRR